MLFFTREVTLEYLVCGKEMNIVERHKIKCDFDGKELAHLHLSSKHRNEN